MKKTQPIQRQLLFNEMKSSEKLCTKIDTFLEPFNDFVSDLIFMPERELQNVFMDADDLNKLQEAWEVLNRVKDNAYQYGKGKAIQFLKISS